MSTDESWFGFVEREQSRWPGMQAERIGLGEAVIRLKDSPRTMDVVVTESHLLDGLVEAASHFAGSTAYVAHGWMSDNGPGVFAPGESEADFEATPGAVGELVWGKRVDVVPMVVVESDPPRLFSFRWCHPDGNIDDEHSLATRVLRAEHLLYPRVVQAVAAGDVRLTADGRVRATLRHSGEVLCLAYSPDGRALAAGGWDGAVKLWDFSPSPKPER